MILEHVEPGDWLERPFVPFGGFYSPLGVPAFPSEQLARAGSLDEVNRVMEGFAGAFAASRKQPPFVAPDVLVRARKDLAPLLFRDEIAR